MCAMQENADTATPTTAKRISRFIGALSRIFILFECPAPFYSEYRVIGIHLWLSRFFDRRAVRRAHGRSLVFGYGEDRSDLRLRNRRTDPRLLAEDRRIPTHPDRAGAGASNRRLRHRLLGSGLR